VPVPEQDGHEVDPDLVDQAGRKVLPAEVGAAHDGHVLVAGGGSGLLERALDAVGHEPVHAARRVLRRGLVRDHEHRPPGQPAWAVSAHHGSESS
jgi:hypothetical protein